MNVLSSIKQMLAVITAPNWLKGEEAARDKKGWKEIIFPVWINILNKYEKIKLSKNS